MSDVERNAFSNLLLLCPNHHRIVDELEPHEWSAEKLHDVKAQHESRRAGDALIPEALVAKAVLALVVAGGLEVAGLTEVGDSSVSSPKEGLATDFGGSVVSDTTPPVLESLELSPSRVATSNGPQEITVTARVTDDLAGTGVGRLLLEIRFRSPSGNQFVDAAMYSDQRISGTEFDGVYRRVVVVPAYSESGLWTAQYALLSDAVGNTRSMTAAELATARLPSSFTNN